MKNSKAFIFTLDAIFSLVVASAAVSILLYVHFTPPTAFQASTSLASGVLKTFLFSKFGSIADSGLFSYSNMIGFPEYGFGYGQRFINQRFGFASFSQAPAGYILSSAAPSLLSNITVSFWVDPVNNTYWGKTGNYWENVVGGSGTSCLNNFYFFIESGSSPPVESWSITNIAGTQYRDFPGARLHPGRWQQLVGVYNGTDLSVYLNGTRIGSPVAASGFIRFDGALISGTNPVSDGGGCNPVSGNLANVQIYKKALTQSQVRQLFGEGIVSTPINGAGLLEWYPLNGNANDYSGNGNNGQAVNTTFSTSNYLNIGDYNASVNQSLLETLGEMYLNGQTATADILMNRSNLQSGAGIFINDSYAPDLRVANFSDSYVTSIFPGTAKNKDGAYIPQGDLTFSIWFNTTSTSGGLQVVGNGTSGNPTANGCDRIIWLDNGILNFNVWSGIDFSGNVPVNNGKWNNIVYVLNQNNGTYAYLNGALYAEDKGATSNCGIGCSGFNWADTYTVGSGMQCRGGALGSNFIGHIANVQVYNTSLGQAQAADIYQAGIAGMPVNTETKSLILWMPLLGNTQDYSGYGNAGIVGGGALPYDISNFSPASLQNAFVVSRYGMPIALKVYNYTTSKNVTRLYNVSVITWR